MHITVASSSLVIALAALTLAGCGGGGASASGEGTSSSGAQTQSTNNQGASGSTNGAELRAGFSRGCRDECVRGGILTDCSAYCDCMFQRMEADGFERRATQIATHPESVTLDPFFQHALAACGPEAIEVGFVNGCSQTDPALRPMCACTLGRLCEGRTHEGCAMWVFENPNFGHTEAEAAELQRVVGLCSGAAR